MSCALLRVLRLDSQSNVQQLSALDAESLLTLRSAQLKAVLEHVGIEARDAAAAERKKELVAQIVAKRQQAAA